MTLRYKLVLVLMPLVIGPLLVIGWLQYRQVQLESERMSLQELDQGLHLVEHELQRLVDGIQASAEMVAGSSLLHRYLRITDEKQRISSLQSSLLSLLQEYQAANSAVYEVRYLLPDGTEEARTVSSAIPNQTLDEGDNPLFLQASKDQKLRYLQVAVNPDNGKYALYYFRRLLVPDQYGTPVDKQQPFRGFLVITVSLQQLLVDIERLQIDRASWFALWHEQGGVISHSWQASGRQFDTPALIDTVRESLLSDALQEFDLAEKAYVLRSRAVPPGLLAVAALPKAHLTDSLMHLAYVVGSVTLLAIVLAVVLIVGLLKRLVLSPLDGIREAMTEIGNGNYRPALALATTDELGDLASAVRVMGESLARVNQEVEYFAFHDQLTGLPNRRLFRDRLQEILHRSERHKEKLALVFLDIDNFKQVNDNFGHPYGDELLVEFGHRLSQSLREEDCLSRAVFSRLGGDEFLILLDEINTPFDAGRVAQRILDNTQKPLPFNESDHYVTVSIGIALYPQDGSDGDTLIRNADLAMYHAKSEGKNNFQYYSAAMNLESSARLTMEKQLRMALDNGEFHLVYQPQLDIASGRVCGFEALLRWRNQFLGDVPPEEFIPVAEDSGLIVDIGHWVLRRACQQNKAWQQRGLPAVPVAVNVSMIQIRPNNLVSRLGNILEQTGLEPKYLILELTESAVMTCSNTCSVMLMDLQKMGIGVMLDDFGTGYSSISQLNKLSLDSIKIDRSFISGLPDNTDSAVTVDTIIALAHSLGIRVIAEGAETAEQLTDLKQRGCVIVQGNHVSLPLEAEAVPAFFMHPDSGVAGQE